MCPRRLPTLVAFATLALACCRAQRVRQECVTDDGLQGVCLRENRCPNDRLILSETTTPCPGGGRRAKICCPKRTAGAGREHCTTSDGLDGVCLRQARCPEDRQLLSTTFTECAGNARRRTKMCCPTRNQGGESGKECITSDGLEGECIREARCPADRQLLSEAPTECFGRRGRAKMCCPLENQGGAQTGGSRPDGGSNPTGGAATGTNQAGGTGLGGFYPHGGLEGDLYSAGRSETGASKAPSVGERFGDRFSGDSDKKGTVEGGEWSDPEAAWLPGTTGHVLHQADSRHSGIRTDDVTLYRRGFGGSWNTGVSSGTGSFGGVGSHRVISSGGGSFRGVGSRREGSFSRGSSRRVPHRTRPSDRCGGHCFGGGARGGGGARRRGGARGGGARGGGARGGGGGGGFNSGLTGATSHGGGFRSSEPTRSTSAVEEQVLEAGVSGGGGGGGSGFNSGSTGANLHGGGFWSSEPTLSTSAIEEQVLEAGVHGGGGGGGGFNSGLTGAISHGGGFWSSETALSTSTVEEQVLEATTLPTVQESQECGRSTPARIWARRRRQASEIPAFVPFIVGGMNSEVGKWPWIAIIGFKQSGKSPFFFCGGALITSQHILTAAHCLRPRSTNVADLVIRLGEHNTASTNDGASPVDYGVASFTNHENFQTPVLHDDISLIKLDTLVETTALIKPICLPPGPTGDYAGSQVEVAGWGFTQADGAPSDILQEVTLTAVSVPECQSKYDTSASFQNQFPGGFGDTKLCAGEKEGGKSACRGDSGGPMARQLADGRYELIGVVSAGVGCGDPGFPGLYTRVSAYLDWIAANAV